MTMFSASLFGHLQGFNKVTNFTHYKTMLPFSNACSFRYTICLALKIDFLLLITKFHLK